MIDGDYVAEYGDGDIEQGCGAMLGQKGFSLIVGWIGSLRLIRSDGVIVSPLASALWRLDAVEGGFVDYGFVADYCGGLSVAIGGGID